MKEKLIELFEANGFIKTNKIRHIDGDSWFMEIKTDNYFIWADTLSFKKDMFYINFGNAITINYGEYAPCISGVTPPTISIEGKISEFNSTLLKYIKEKL